MWDLVSFVAIFVVVLFLLHLLSIQTLDLSTGTKKKVLSKLTSNDLEKKVQQLEQRLKELEYSSNSKI